MKGGGGKGGPKGGCFICKGPHYADQCPKQGGSMNAITTLDAWMPDVWSWGTGQVSKLCGIYEVASKTCTTKESPRKEIKPTTGPRWLKSAGEMEEEEAEYEGMAELALSDEEELEMSKKGKEE